MMMMMMTVVKVVYVGKNNKFEYNIVIHDMVDIILEYVNWYIVHHRMNVDFNDHISCIATSPEVNNGAGFIVVGGFAKLLQCFLPMQ